MKILRPLAVRIGWFALLGGVASWSAACSGSTSPAPLPPSAHRVAVYDAAVSSLYGARYILYSDSTFTFTYSRPGGRSFDYQGRYARAQFQIVFNFGFFTPAGPWQSIGVLTDDSEAVMAVSYNELMKWLSFRNDTYIRASPNFAPLSTTATFSSATAFIQ